MNKLDIIKGGAEFMVSVGIASIVGNAIKLTTDPEAGRLKKISIGVGGFVLTSMVSSMAIDYSNSRIDNTAATLGRIFGSKTEKDVDDTETEEVPE